MRIKPSFSIWPQIACTLSPCKGQRHQAPRPPLDSPCLPTLPSSPPPPPATSSSPQLTQGYVNCWPGSHERVGGLSLFQPRAPSVEFPPKVKLVPETLYLGEGDPLSIITRWVTGLTRCLG